jgi:hypothetical protein
VTVVTTIPDLRVWLILALVLGCVPAASAANVTIEQGDTFNLPNSNTSITWGYDQTFSIDQLAGYNDTLGIGDRNISIYEENGGSVNVTVFDYNLSRPVERGQDFLQFQVDADTGSDVVFRLTGFPELDEGSYRVNGRDRVLAQRYDGGTLSWTDGDWSKKNITVRYDVQEDDSGTGGGSIDVDPFCRGDARASELHSWYTNRSQFAINSFEQGIELEEMTASTGTNVSEFKLCAQRLDTVLVEEPSSSVYAYYNLTSTHTEAVTAATATFQVDEPFVNTHDEVRVARYSDGWTDLNADRIETGVYQVDLNRFSRFAVYGVNETDTGTEPGDGTGEPDDNETDGNESDGSIDPICGDGQCTGNETWSTCPNDCPKPHPVVEAESSLAAARSNISQDDPGYSALQQAENAYENEEYDRAASLADQALEQYRTAQRDDDGGLPLLPLVAGGLLLIVAFVGVWKRQAVIDRYHRFHRDRHQQETEQRVNEIQGRRDEDDHGYDPSGRKTERRLNDVSTRVRDALETEEYSTKIERKLYDYLNQASEAVQEEDYLQAARVLDRVEELLEDKE